GANVALQASRDVYVKDRIALTTAGAGISIDAGGPAHTGGSIYLEDLVSRPGGISTNGGAVTLRAASIEQMAGISTGGGAVDIETTGALTYAGAIRSTGGSVRLASSGSGVAWSDVDAGSGEITVSAQNNVNYGTYTTTGTLNVTSAAGGVSGNGLVAGVVNVQAQTDIHASPVVADRFNATTTSGSIFLATQGSDPLRLGTLQATNGSIELRSYGPAIEQAAGGSLTTAGLQVYTYGNIGAVGSLANPLKLVSATPTNVLFNGLAAPAHLRLDDATKLNSLSLLGTVDGLGGFRLSGGANIGGWSFSSTSGAVNVSGYSFANFLGQFSLTVENGGINVGELDLQGGGSTALRASGAVNVGKITTTSTSGTGVSVYTSQCTYQYSACTYSSPITIGTIDAGAAGVNLNTTDSGQVKVTGGITAGSLSLTAGRNYYTEYVYYPYNTYITQPSTNGVDIAALAITGAVNINQPGHGDVRIGSLSAGGGVSIATGSTYFTRTAPSSYAYLRTVGDIAITAADAVSQAGALNVTNNSTGDLTLAGTAIRGGYVQLRTYDGGISVAQDLVSGADVSLSASGGGITTANITANGTSYSGIYLTASDAITTGDITANGRYSGVSLSAGGAISTGDITTAGSYVTLDADAGDITFDKLSAVIGTVTATASAGSIVTRSDDAAADITAGYDVALSAQGAQGSIGNSALANPMDIVAGAASTVSLAAGKDVGTAGHAVNVDTSGGIAVSSQGGTFNVVLKDLSVADTGLRSVSSIELAASAAGVGDGNSADFTSANLSIKAASDGVDLTLGDPVSGALAQSTGSLDLLRFTGLGDTGLKIGDVSLTTAGANTLELTTGGTGHLTQTTGAIAAGEITLTAANGDIAIGNVTSAQYSSISLTAGGGVTSGNLSAPDAYLSVSAGLDVTTGDLLGRSVTVSGQNVSIGSAESTGTFHQYNYYDPPSDVLSLTASGNITTSGNLASGTTAYVNASGDVAIGPLLDGGGSVTAGRQASWYFTDTARVFSGGTLTAGDIKGYAIDLHAVDATVGSLRTTGAGVDTQTLEPLPSSGSIVFNGGNLTARDVTTYGAVNFTATDLLDIGAVAAATINLEANDFALGVTAATSSLSINALGDFITGGRTALSAPTATITAAGKIEIGENDTLSMTSDDVRLTAGGDIAAHLNQTRYLRIRAGEGFNVQVNNSLLSQLDIEAQWDKVTASLNGGSVNASLGDAGQSFNLSSDGPLYLSAYSYLGQDPVTLPSWTLRYKDVSTTANANGVEAYISHAAGGSAEIRMDSDTNVSMSANMGSSGASANMTFETGGTLTIQSASTQGGYLHGTSRNGDVIFTSIDTSVARSSTGGNVELTSELGNISFEAPPIVSFSLVDNFSAGSSGLYAPGATVTLAAREGSLGAADNPLPLGGMARLDLF
ncbi:MAG TPA: hypothetical protein VLJ62_22685, partial [Burkholderiaceae bacterium]|nr:hypothetical protein [Burkholderiaceae bacterium]